MGSPSGDRINSALSGNQRLTRCTAANGWPGARVSLHVFQEFFFVDVCLFENGKQGACGNLRMVGNRNKPPAFRVQQMDMAAGLSYRFEPKKGENFYDLKS
jgi:hypothetical protein